MHETMWPQGQELLGLEWQQFSENTFTEQPITKVKQEGIKSSQPEASKKVYTPPHLRLISEGKNPEKYIPQLSTIPGLPPGNRWKYWHKQYDTKDPIIRQSETNREQSSSTNSYRNQQNRKFYQYRTTNRFQPYKK